jgi:hypothetical protein
MLFPEERAAPAGPAVSAAEPAAVSRESAAIPGGPAATPARPAPGARPRHAGPSARSSGKSAGRQAQAARKVTVTLATLVLVGVMAGNAEIALHGLPFFVFRANGAGASVTGLTEDQGPGQPNAPGAHLQTTPVPRATPSPGN